MNTLARTAHTGRALSSASEVVELDVETEAADVNYAIEPDSIAGSAQNFNVMQEVTDEK